MKRFFAREFALLLLPVALVAGVGFWAARRPAPTVYVGPQLQFSVDKPTTLQAFDGVKTVLSASVGDDSAGTHYWLDTSQVWLEVASPQGAHSWRSDKSSEADDAWISQYHSHANSVAVKQLPAGAVIYGISGSLVELGKPTAPRPVVLKHQWKVDRAQIQPCDFSLPRAPLVTLKSVTITKQDYYNPSCYLCKANEFAATIKCRPAPTQALERRNVVLFVHLRLCRRRPTLNCGCEFIRLA